jgi:hypothetical protein
MLKSAFNAQGSRLIIVVVQVGAVKIYVAAVEAGRSGKIKDRMKLCLPPKLVEKLVWVPIISRCKIFIPSSAFDALLCQNWPFSPPNRLTLQITLIREFQYRLPRWNRGTQLLIRVVSSFTTVLWIMGLQWIVELSC